MHVLVASAVIHKRRSNWNELLIGNILTSVTQKNAAQLNNVQFYIHYLVALAAFFLEFKKHQLYLAIFCCSPVYSIE